MNPLLFYMLKVAVFITAFYLLYILLLSRDTMYSRNRFYILLSLMASLILPFVIIHTREPIDVRLFGIDLTGVVITASPETSDNRQGLLSMINIFLVLNIIYLAGTIILGLKLMIEIIQLLFLVFGKKKEGTNVIRLSGNKVSGFTAFGHIFIDEVLSAGDEEEIIRHEQKHLDRHHSFDILFMEILKLFQWFNPFIYMFDRSLRAVHEYQADEECLNSGIPVVSYQGLMLDQVFRTKVFSGANRFSNPTLIKKRMIMMTKKRSKVQANFKIIMVLPVIVFLLIAFSTCSKTSFDSFSGGASPGLQEKNDNGSVSVVNKAQASVKEGDAYVVVEEMPVFPGGDIALLKYIAENTQYPEEAKEKNIQGRVIIRFKVMDDGMVNDASVIKGVEPLLDAEALRVVKTLPQFEPGKQDGVAVPVWYMVPITFTLKDKSTAVPPPPPPPPTADDSKGSAEPFVVVEEMPMFPGGDAALLQYLTNNTIYPESAKANGITGRVIVRFCVTETGTVDRISVLKGVDPALDAEAFRVVSSLPAFQPGKQGGVAVPVWYMVPVNFSLSESNTTGSQPVAGKDIK